MFPCLPIRLDFLSRTTSCSVPFARLTLCAGICNDVVIFFVFSNHEASTNLHHGTDWFGDVCSHWLADGAETDHMAVISLKTTACRKGKNDTYRESDVG